MVAFALDSATSFVGCFWSYFHDILLCFSIIKEKLPGMTCSDQFECRTELSCLDGTCNCSDTEFLEEHKCLPNTFEGFFFQWT